LRTFEEKPRLIISDEEQTRAAMLIVYFTGKFATRAAFIVIIVYTCEIFPTGYRCTALGICYTFRLIGVILASPDAVNMIKKEVSFFFCTCLFLKG